METNENEVSYVEVSKLNITTEKKNRKIFNRFLVFFLVVILLAGSFWIGYQRGRKSLSNFEDKSVSFIGSAVINGKSNVVDFSLFWNVWDLLKDKYVDKNSLDAQKMLYGAIEGMLRATGDPYSSFFDPKNTREFSQDLQGSFQGIGAELGMKDNILTIITPLDDSPAQKAGLRAGDKILKIDDKISADLTIDEAVDLIHGKKGTEVKLTILRLGEQDTREITVVRDIIEIKSVKLELKPDGIAYIKINKFGEETYNEFNAAMNSILAKDTKGIILDLRNNPGGFLDRCVNIASRMIPSGKVVVTEEDNTGEKDNLYTKGGDKLSSIPTVVLINEGSASASEILAAALHDDQDVQLIGKKSDLQVT